jgi:copper chaperone NosL
MVTTNRQSGRDPMRKILTFCTVFWAAALCFGAVSFGAESGVPATAQQERCPVCGMFVSLFADWNGEIEFADSSSAVFDGSKDLFKYYFDIGKYNPAKNMDDVVAVRVKDYYSKTYIDARRAFYVIWSDVYGPMGHEPIPFEKEDDARRFLKAHKAKKILRFNGITQRLLVSLDNP